MKLAVKFLVTAVLLWAVFRSVDVGVVLLLISRLDLLWALASLLLTALIIVSDATLFAGTMRIQAWRVPFGVALLYSLVGWFFGNLAPSTVGGDIFRGAQLSRQGAPVGVAVRAIVSMRLISLATLFIVMVAGFPVALGLVEESRDALLLATVLAVACGALAAIFLLALAPLPSSLLQRWRILRRFNAVADDVRKLLAPSMHSAVIWFAALAQHLLRIGVLASLAAGLGLDIPIATLFAFTPAALLAAMVPISLGGWGVREAAFVYFLGTAQVGGEAALTLSIAFGFLRLFVGAIGGLAWVLFGKDRYRIEAPTA